MKYNICTIQPPGYIHARAFDEIAILVGNSLKDLGHDVNFQSNQIDTKARNIIIGCHLIDKSSASIVPKDSIVINTEQLSPEIGSWGRNILYWLQEYNAWDYSKKNIEYIHRAGLREPKQLILGYHGSLNTIKKLENEDVDILFYGSLNDRRKAILEALVHRGCKVKHLFGVYGIERDKWIARTKVVLNIHYFETKIFEIVRCFYLMINAKAVVSEISNDTSIDSIYRSGVNGVEYKKIVDECYNLVKDEAIRRKYEMNAFDTIKTINSVENIRTLVG